MKSIILFTFMSLAAFAEILPQPPMPPVHCNSIIMSNGVPVFLCAQDPPLPPQQQPLHCDSITMVNGLPVFVCLAR
jgi:hypothetical protein